MKKSFFLILFFTSLCSISFGQDSVKIFTQENLFWYLTKYHPVSKQAALLTKKGENEVRKQRGQLDPALFSNFYQKQFDEQEYYKLFSGGLKIPTWYGVDLSAGLDQNLGVNLNPEDKLPSNGLLFAGVSVPLGQGLFIDKRRASIKQAKLYLQRTGAEQELILNQLYYDATVSYFNWVSHYNQLMLYQNALNLANERFTGILLNFKGGDVPAIDTLEAFILVQVREVNLNQALVNYKNATLDLSTFLWFENNTPLEITNQLVPPTLADISITNTITPENVASLIRSLKIDHPQLQWYDLKVKQLEVEKKWNAEQLKPTVNLKYNFLNEPVEGDLYSGFSTRNYVWGVDFSFPIFIRESRGRLNITKLTILETNLELELKQLELTNKIKSSYNEFDALIQQIAVFDNATKNYFTLLEAEKQKFLLGESSIFLINNREANYVQAAIKRIELYVKYQSKLAEFKSASATW
jgi:outer membrane protein TolC